VSRRASNKVNYLARGFFERDPLTCSRELIGCELRWNGCAGRIVEVEAYAQEGDEASHTFVRPSARQFITDHEAGAAYVYLNYGVHWMLNVLCKGGTTNGFVLIRALEPTIGAREMEERRLANANNTGPIIFSLRALCSGPGKLAQALGVVGSDHGRDLCAGGEIGFVPPAEPVEVETDIRIGISKAANLPWRFLERGSEFVSVRPGRGVRVARQVGASSRRKLT
jgi:DNA-3-methyladenine glycosylase